MIEKDLEAAIISALEALALTGLEIHGAWQAAAEGTVKDMEDSAAVAGLAVAVSPRVFDTFGISTANFDVALSLAVRADQSPTGAALETYADPIANLLSRWNLELCHGNDCGLGVSGFVPGGLQMTGGSGPTFDRDAAAWSIIYSFTLRGNIEPVETPASPTTNTEE